jgi:MFS family permease
MQQFKEYLRLFGRFQRNARLFLLQSALVGMVIGAFVLLHPLYLAEIGYTTDRIGLVLFFIPLGMGLAIIPAGLCVDRLSGKAILIWSSAVIAMAVTGQILFRDLVLLCVSAFVMGTGVSFQYVLNAPFLTKNSTPEERPHLFSLNLVLLLATGVIGAVLGGAMPLWLRTHPWAMFPQLSWLLASGSLARSYQITMLFGVLTALSSFLPLLLMTSDRRAQVKSGQHPLPPVLSSPRKLRKGGESDALTQPDATERGNTSSFGQRLRRFLFSPLVIMAAATFLAALGTGLFYPYMGLYFVEHLGANSALFGLVSGASSAILAFAVLLSPWMVMRMGRLKTIVVTNFLALPALIVMIILPLLPLVVLLYPLFWVLWNMTDGIQQLFSMEVVPPKLHGRANSSYQIAGQVASIVATLIGGFLLSRIGYTPVFWITTVLYFLTTVLLWWGFSGKRFASPISSESEGQEEEEKMRTDMVSLSEGEPQ